ncbi:MAG TPA: hypothetical protein DIT67_09460 [Octadecabacter sp.]|nr:hypothetical protein [Octadecabacter sp.]
MNAPYNQQFPFPVVAEAAQVPYDTMKKWVLRGHLVMSEDDRETLGRGGARMLSYHTTVQALIAADLYRQGVTISEASEAALEFAHFGDDMRDAGGLFVGAATVLTYNADSQRKARVLRVSKSDSFQSVLGKTWPNGMASSAIFLDVQMLLLRRSSALGMDRGWIIETLED